MNQRQRLLSNLTFLDLFPPTADSAREVAASLSAPTPFLNPKYFYDARGSQLFSAITRTPEYYLARTEAALLAEHADVIAAQLPDELRIIEPGAGECDKVQVLLERWRPDGYMPLEISRQCLLGATRQLAPQHPHIQFDAVCADYGQGFGGFEAPWLSQGYHDQARLVFFPGSTIGNFDPATRADFLAGLRQLAGDDGYLLIGMDLHKDPARLNAAYNDAAGYTAAFNLNVLQHLNSSLGCNFDPQAFEHIAFYNEAERRVEMHLHCLCDQTVQIDGQRIDMAAGSRIHTESSYKFTISGFASELQEAGFAPTLNCVDDNEFFSLQLARSV